MHKKKFYKRGAALWRYWALNVTPQLLTLHCLCLSFLLHMKRCGRHMQPAPVMEILPCGCNPFTEINKNGAACACGWVLNTLQENRLTLSRLLDLQFKKIQMCSLIRKSLREFITVTQQQGSIDNGLNRAHRGLMLRGHPDLNIYTRYYRFYYHYISCSCSW